MNKKNKLVRPTIVDVANYAGVSTMTVSRVIRKQAKVSDATRKKVNHAIVELGYSPNLIARALVGAKVKRICILFGSLSSPFLGEVMFGALKATNAHDMNLLVENVEGEPDLVHIAEQFHSQWDGIVIPPPMSDVPALRKLVKTMNFPAVFLSSAIEPSKDGFLFNDIRIDDYKSAFEMTQLLIKKGHKRIAFLKGDDALAVSEKRLQGYADAMLEAKLPIFDEYIEFGDFTFGSGEEKGLTLLSLSRPPTAIFASNDDMAAGVITAAKHKGITIPSQLAVVGFDDSAIASIISPALTTVRQPVAEMAQQAIYQLLGDNKPPEVGVQWLDHAIVERETT